MINDINDIIIASIINGGDSGGPYFCAEKELEQTINNFLINNNLNNLYKIDYIKIDGYCDKFPQIRKK